jgi:uncharacterized membrane protein
MAVPWEDDMTDPTDEIQPHPIAPATPDDEAPASDADATPGVILPPPGPASAGEIAAPAPPPLVSEPTAPGDRDPAPPAVTPPVSQAAPPGAVPPLRADPNRPAASEWREPPWFPPRERARDRGPSIASMVIGLVIVAIGVYFLLDVTLGFDLPRFRLATLWPLLLVAIGGLIVLRAVGRR